MGARWDTCHICLCLLYILLIAPASGGVLHFLLPIKKRCSRQYVFSAQTTWSPCPKQTHYWLIPISKYPTSSQPVLLVRLQTETSISFHWKSEIWNIYAPWCGRKYLMILQMSMGEGLEIAIDSWCRSRAVFQYTSCIPDAIPTNCITTPTIALVKRLKIALYNDQDITYPMTLYSSRQNVIELSYSKI